MKKSTYVYFLILIISIIDMNASNINYQINEAKEKKVIFFGNSITQVWSNYTDFFSDNGYLNKGISGQTTDQMLLRFKKDVVDEKADCVVILAGINDLAENNGSISLEDIFENISSQFNIFKIDQEIYKKVLEYLVDKDYISYDNESDSYCKLYY